MDDYITRIRKTRKNYEAPKKSQAPQKVPEVSEEEIYVEYEEPSKFLSWFNNLFSAKPRQEEDELLEEDIATEDKEELEGMEDEIEHVEEEIEELEEKRESLLQGFLRRMRMSRRKKQGPSKDELLEEVVPMIDEDVKEVLKILHVWLEKLPNQELRQFKVSEDFSKYRDILEKYDLIKK